MSYLDRIDAYQEEMLSTLQELIAIPSVKTEAGGPGEPFGPDLARALNYVLTWGEKNGFATKNISGYAGHLEYGTGDETVGVLVHLDVVPAGDGWKYPPFSGQRAEARIYGRGAIDDKGPAIAAMYAIKALKEEGVKLNKKIRLIFGCDEESGWQCMEHYFKHEPKPEYGFTPDANFPLINCEKGQLGLVIEGELQSAQTGCRIESLTGGSRRNVVPEWAEAVITFPDQQSLEAFVASIPEERANEVQLSAGPKEQQLSIRVKGVSAHASLPQEGDNAVTKLVEIIATLNGTGGCWPAVRFIHECFGRETDGRGLGINYHDQISGDLTINLGVFKIEQQKVKMEVDIRYPLCTSGEELQQKIEQKLATYNLKITNSSALAPHYLAEDNWLIKTLLQAYREETGDQSAPLAIGGRTYAVTLGNAVAFGPVFPGRPEIAHQKDEYISIQDLMACTRIYAKALYELAKADTESV
ncbi:MAG: dipeptidase PepV [Firmicutes bacterium]|nr:dipeptidase PepV [Bacillota bacterium]